MRHNNFWTVLHYFPRTPQSSWHLTLPVKYAVSLWAARLYHSIRWQLFTLKAKTNSYKIGGLFFFCVNGAIGGLLLIFISLSVLCQKYTVSKLFSQRKWIYWWSCFPAPLLQWSEHTRIQCQLGFHSTKKICFSLHFLSLSCIVLVFNLAFTKNKRVLVLLFSAWDSPGVVYAHKNTMLPGLSQ